MILTSGLSLPEAPLSLPDGTWLVTEMGSDRGSVTHISLDGQTKRMLVRTGRPNGLARDEAGNLWITETLNPALMRLTADGDLEVWATECDGQPLLFPNDLAFGPDGALYMTDSGIRVQEFMPGGRLRHDFDFLPYDGRIYRIDIASRDIRKIDEGLHFANGIAFGPDGDLYVSETLTGAIYRYPWQGGALGPRLWFSFVIEPPCGPVPIQGPDGIKFSADGNLYVAIHGQGNVAVLGQDGQIVRHIETRGRMPTNLAFGPGNEERIYVTEDELGSLEVLEAGAAGLPLFSDRSKEPALGRQ